ncbi:radical SAM/SPASM domain-containing protein [Desulfovibrio inopinatus]|uniref:radical SAM/SPASM domain-containing protein n=1 Tax=Desulfovibrio inopinatus TaxID=102109 RepID=UPI0004153FD9|nr:radical SAM protein [Desulfovibrio inopinatus]
MHTLPDFVVEPIELKIEITRACNLRCSFCYLGSMDRWSAESHMPTSAVMDWIDWCVDNDVPAVRFTGGEATLHPDIELLCNYAQVRKRYVILNSNGMADPALYNRLLVNDLRVSIPTLDPQSMDEITGCSDVLAKKIAAIDQALARGLFQVVMFTVMTPEMLGKLHEFIPFLQARPQLKWGPLRFESSPDDPRPLTREIMQALAEEMSDLMDAYPETVKGIGIAAPFCSVTPTSLGAKVFFGRGRACGPFKALNVNFDGMLTACFGTCELFTQGSLDDVRNSPVLHAHCSYEVLPEECHECEYIEACAGGCRKPATLAGHNGRQVDYLAEFVQE